MARLIVKSPYIKCNGSQGATGYMKYIATRERVEILPDDRPPTRKQEQLISKLSKDFPGVKELLEYEDYAQHPTKANASALITLALEENWSKIFFTELTTGLRRGELCGLQWSDFDEASGRLKVRRTIHPRKGGGVEVGDTKTYAGTRTILLPSSTTQMLRERKQSALSQWIFPDPLRPEQPVSPSKAYRRLKELLQEAGLPDIRFHDLRHTFATHALSSGVDAKTLSGILGHTKASFTLDTYTHVTGEMQRNAADIVGGFLTELLGEEMEPWQESGNVEMAVST